MKKDQLLSDFLNRQKKHSISKRRSVLPVPTTQATPKEVEDCISKPPQNFNSERSAYLEKIKLQPKPEREVKYNLSVYITANNHENLRYFKMKTRHSKQAIVEAALTEFFKKVFA